MPQDSIVTTMDSSFLKIADLHSLVPKLTGTDNFAKWDTSLTSALRAMRVEPHLLIATRPPEPLQSVHLPGDPMAVVTAINLAKSKPDGTLPPPKITRPGEGSSDPPRVEAYSLSELQTAGWTQWARHETYARFAIESTLGDKIKAQFAHYPSVGEMYLAITSRYKVTSHRLVETIKTELYALKVASNASTRQLQNYNDKFNELYSRLLLHGGSLENHEVATRFLIGLPPMQQQYLTVSSGPDATFEALQRNFYEYIAMQEAHSPAENNLSATVDASRTSSSSSKKSKGKRKTKADYPPPSPEDIRQAKAANKWCENHLVIGHSTQNCRHPPASNPKSQARPGGNGTIAPKPTVSALSSYDDGVHEPGKIAFLIDSGATLHLTSDLSILANTQLLATPHRIRLAATDHYIEATHVGDIMVDNTQGGITISDVFFSPSTKGHFLSEEALRETGWKVDRDTLHLTKDKLHLTLNRRPSQHRLVYLTFDAPPVDDLAPIVLPHPQGTSLKDLHHRLGHLSRSRLLDLINAGAIDGISPDMVADDTWTTLDCAACAAAKTTRLPAPGPSPRGTSTGEVIHADIKGPISPQGSANELYILTMIADYVGYCDLKPLLTKDQAPLHLKSFVHLVEKQANVPVKALRTDGGGEFNNAIMKKFCSKQGIRHEMTPANTPQLNGVAERLNRTANEHISSLIKSSDLASSDWPYAAQYVAHLLNVTTLDDNRQTPFEKMFGRKPNLASVRPFGERVFARDVVVNYQLGTYQRMRSFEARVLSRTPTRSAWLVRRLEPSQVIVARDIFKHDPDGPGEAHEITDDDSPVPAEPHQPGLQLERPASPIVAEPGDIVEPRDEPAPLTIDQPTDMGANAIENFIALDAFTDDEGALAIVPVDDLKALPLIAAIASDDADDSWGEPDPVSVNEALNSPDRDKWLAAMRVEVDQLTNKGTWIETNLPDGRQAITAKWVFHRKRDKLGNVVKYKARLVARGFTQVQGVDYDETFAPVTRMATLRLLFAIAGTLDLELRQIDVEGAYLNGKITEELYLSPPDAVRLTDSRADVFRLKSALYGLKQSGRVWWQELDRRLVDIGFVRCPDEWGLHVRTNDDHSRAYVSAYVDDIIIATSTTGEADNIIADLAKRWTIKDLGEPQHILGVRVDRDRTMRTINLSQGAYIAHVNKRFHVDTNAGKNAPLPTTSEAFKDFTVDRGEQPAKDAPRIRRYQEMVGVLLWIAGATRPDIAFAASFLGRLSHAPTDDAESLVHRVLAYLQRTCNDGIIVGGLIATPLQAFADAGYASCLATRRSTTGVITFYNNSPITWISRRQPTISASTTEAEFIAAAEAAREVVWLRRVLAHLGHPQGSPTPLFVDNEAAVALGSRPISFPLNKHIDVRRHLVREHVADKTIVLKTIKTTKQRADVLTKPLSGPRHQIARSQLRIATS